MTILKLVTEFDKKGGCTLKLKTSLNSIYIIGAAILWGCIALFYDGLTRVGYSSSQVVCLRVVSAAILLAIYIGLKDPSLFRIRLRDIWMFIGTGVISLAFFNYCYFRAMDCLSHAVAAVLLYTAPIFVMLMSAVFFRESITVVKIISLALALVGCLLVTGVFAGGVTTPIGVLFGLGSGIGYALYTIFGTVAAKRYRSETISFYTFVLAGVAILPFADPADMYVVAVSFPTESILYGVGIGLFICVLPYVLYTKGLRTTEPSRASILATLEPVVAAAIGVCVLHDPFSAEKGIGMVLIVGSIILLQTLGNKKM